MGGFFLFYMTQIEYQNTSPATQMLCGLESIWNTLPITSIEYLSSEDRRTNGLRVLKLLLGRNHKKNCKHDKNTQRK